MTATPIPWNHVRNVLILFVPLWGGAAILFGLAGATFAVLDRDLYSARQPIVVCDEASTSFDRLGRFESQTELKAAQETILEMTQNPEVVAAALSQIGPPLDSDWESWPNAEVIDEVASDCVNLLAPKGSEFGNTDVVYLQVKANSRSRAKAFCDAMFEKLIEQLREVRRVRADSVIAELTHTRELANKNLDEALYRLREIEVSFGADLGELRNLNETIPGDRTSRRSLAETTDELQSAELELEKLKSVYDLLVASSEDPQDLLVSGNDWLASQPSLQRLKEELLEAKLDYSRISTVYTADHPRWKVVRATELEIQARLREETESVIKAMEPMIQSELDRVQRLSAREDQLRERLVQLARARTDYAKLDAEVAHRTRLLAEAERALTEATASRSAALSTSLIAKLGPPQVTDKPIGPNDLVVVCGSTTAGIVFGLGAVFLIAPGPTERRSGRRWSDYIAAGRRSTDNLVATEGNDHVAAEGFVSRPFDPRRPSDQALIE